jgi:hypothetical protein
LTEDHQPNIRHHRNNWNERMILLRAKSVGPLATLQGNEGRYVTTMNVPSIQSRLWTGSNANSKLQFASRTILMCEKARQRKTSPNASTEVHVAVPLIGTSNQGIPAGELFIVYTGRIGPHAGCVGRKPIHSELEYCRRQIDCKMLANPSREMDRLLSTHTHTRLLQSTRSNDCKRIGNGCHRAVSNGHMPRHQS